MSQLLPNSYQDLSLHSRRYHVAVGGECAGKKRYQSVFHTLQHLSSLNRQIAQRAQLNKQALLRRTCTWTDDVRRFYIRSAFIRTTESRGCVMRNIFWSELRSKKAHDRKVPAPRSGGGTSSKLCKASWTTHEHEESATLQEIVQYMFENLELALIS